MDLMLTKDGDLYISKDGDIAIEESVSQKIKIRLKWLLNEWRFDKEEGLAFKELLFIKNPDIDNFEMAVREKIFEVEEVVEVKDVSISYSSNDRIGTILFTALTDFETIRGEVVIDGKIRSD